METLTYYTTNLPLVKCKFLQRYLNADGVTANGFANAFFALSLATAICHAHCIVSSE